MLAMDVQEFEGSLLSLKGTITNISPHDEISETSDASVRISFSDGSTLRADYWRLIKHSKADISSFDHNQKYGLPAPIDAIRHLRNELAGTALIEARRESQTGDLRFIFDNGIEMQVLNFTSYEVWELCLPDKISMYSNYAK